MELYNRTSPETYSGRASNQNLYVHEKVLCVDVSSLEKSSDKRVALLGYACDEGVKRNQGRFGAVKGPDAIRKKLGKLPNHLDDETALLDVGSIHCSNADLETAQDKLAHQVQQLLNGNLFPIVLGGGHDIAYGTYNGIKKYLGNAKSIGIINFDAHFDLRSNQDGNTSGTPFYQIAKDCEASGTAFHYLCLGIREDANDSSLFKTAKELDVKYILRDTFRIEFHNEINAWINAFIQNVDAVYVTIDLDGFSSAYAPGVSAPSPMGFTPDVVLASLKTIIASGKLTALDIAELNPTYDIDDQTARLAASLVHSVIHSL
ncbi:formimidoylglutamase [Maribacter antarcticus]|uniref:formimidoylglutamase n=1 Tax=Maribacter antarcticus TaxID=505250 RepID=UPI0004787DE0|nr:formimidoylglutamase [Maribacter antarcticus]